MEITEDVKNTILKYETVIDKWRSIKSLSLSRNQKKELEAVHIILGYGKVNISCGTCCSQMMNKMVIALDKIRQND